MHGQQGSASNLLNETHTHVDHLSGLVDALGGLAFPDAERVFVPVGELGDFRAAARMAAVLAQVVPLEQDNGPTAGVVAINAGFRGILISVGPSEVIKPAHAPERGIRLVNGVAHDAMRGNRGGIAGDV